MDAAHESHDGDPVAADISERDPATADAVAGEQVLDEGRVAPDQDELRENARPDADAEESPDERAHAADERTDAGAPPAQEEPG